MRDARIVLCRISSHLKEHAGQWTLPGGGIEFGEDPEDAMVREVREETGLEVRSKGVAGIDSLLIPDGTSATHSVRIVYFAGLVGGELRNELDGSTDLCEWHELAAIGSLPVVGLVESGLGYSGGDL